MDFTKSGQMKRQMHCDRLEKRCVENSRYVKGNRNDGFIGAIKSLPPCKNFDFTRFYMVLAVVVGQHLW